MINDLLILFFLMIENSYYKKFFIKLVDRILAAEENFLSLNFKKIEENSNILNFKDLSTKFRLSNSEKNNYLLG